ncbi:MAG: thioredoxin domain-containing protein [Polyangiaceae bacterium]|nr:thioredoxin domain-containing protein [Polyangiaceae bacterium]
MNRSELIALGLLVCGLAACSGGSGTKSPPQADATVAVPLEVKLLAEPTTPPEPLEGVLEGELSDRERGNYWRWVSQLYAPCSGIATSIAQCVSEKKPCASCEIAASFLADRARAGDSQADAITAFVARFGSDIKKVDLADSPVRGNPDAPVTVVVWSDYECPACGHAVPKIEKLLHDRKNDVRLVHKLYPLKSHTHSRPAARAALAAKKQGKYWEMEALLFAHQSALEDADLEKYANEIQLDMGKFKRDFADPKADAIIDRDRAEGDKHGLTGTPFILINGREIDLGIFQLDRDFLPWIDAELRILKKEEELRAVAGLGGALTGQGLGPVSPLSTGVMPVAAPAASATPSASSTASSPAQKP